VNAWAVSQVEHLSPVEIAGAILAGILALWLILALFRRRPAPPPGQASTTLPPSSTGPLAPAIQAAEGAIRALARQRVPLAGVFHIGAVDLSPFNLAFWITTPTDAERDMLAADTELQDEFRRILLRAGYPADAVLKVGFAFQSQQTVDRDYGGNWWYAVK